MDPVSAVATAVGRLADAAPAFALAVRPDPAVAAVRAERLRRGLVRFDAHHRGRLVEAAGRLRREIARRPPSRVRDGMEARLEGVVATLAGLTT
jgi:hypothetical protein